MRDPDPPITQGLLKLIAEIVDQTGRARHAEEGLA